MKNQTQQQTKVKKRFGDRKDGTLIRDIDALHFIVPLLYPNRCDNEAYISENIDLTNINAWLAKKNAEIDEFPYTMFHVVVAAALKTLTLRPKMNRFIANKNLYQRNNISAAFVVKKQFNDESEEGLAFIRSTPEYTIADVREEIRRQSTLIRSDKKDSSSESMDMFNKMPRFISKSIIRFIRFLDTHGKVPASLIESDPYYASVVLSNLGSIKLKSGYHHLTNWGTNSLFCIIGEKKKSVFFDDDGKAFFKETVDLGLTVDERIADGYYYSKTVKLLKKLLENPELLESPFNERIDF
ncbi:MAG: 2-oxo acid dehydrogenase subunit E2 [Oscillospiraceae bacterium]|nr:2-oxo acid dehydrogenase subunit E2 [Oscillospiraceae bacterium]